MILKFFFFTNVKVAKLTNEPYGEIIIYFKVEMNNFSKIFSSHIIYNRLCALGS